MRDPIGFMEPGKKHSPGASRWPGPLPAVSGTRYRWTRGRCQDAVGRRDGGRREDGQMDLPGWRALICRAGRWGRMEGTNLSSHLRHPHRRSHWVQFRITLALCYWRPASVLSWGHGRMAEPEIEKPRCPTSARVPLGPPFELQA